MPSERGVEGLLAQLKLFQEGICGGGNRSKPSWGYILAVDRACQVARISKGVIKQWAEPLASLFIRITIRPPTIYFSTAGFSISQQSWSSCLRESPGSTPRFGRSHSICGALRVGQNPGNARIAHLTTSLPSTASQNQARYCGSRRKTSDIVLPRCFPNGILVVMYYSSEWWRAVFSASLGTTKWRSLRLFSKTTAVREVSRVKLERYTISAGNDRAGRIPQLRAQASAPRNTSALCRFCQRSAVPIPRE